MLSSIYLTGGTVDTQDIAVQGLDADWRSLAMTKLHRCGLRVINPLEFAWGKENEPTIEYEEGLNVRVRHSLELIDQCDALLANLNRPSYGTAMEIFYAFRRGKMVTVVGQSPFSPWVLSHSQARFGDIDHALDYIIEEQPQSLPLDWAIQYETLLAERYEELPQAGEPDYKFIGGELPILVVAPHATAYWKEGEFQEADAYTGSMAALLSKLSGCHTLLTNYCCVADPCSYLETPFCRAFIDIARAGQIALILFLLGASWHESPGLQMQLHGNADDYANRLKLRLMALENVLTDKSDNGVGNLPYFAAHELGINTIVLKMHKRYRMPRLQPEPYTLLNEALADFILEAGQELLRGKN